LIEAAQSPAVQLQNPALGTAALDGHTLRFARAPTICSGGHVAHVPFAQWRAKSLTRMATTQGHLLAQVLTSSRWKRGTKITLEANPDYAVVWIPEPAAIPGPGRRQGVRGKTMPQIGRSRSHTEESSRAGWRSTEGARLPCVAGDVPARCSA
jgi:hypothetical protein